MSLACFVARPLVLIAAAAALLPPTVSRAQTPGQGPLPSTAFDAAGAATSAAAAVLGSSLQKSSNLSDLASPSQARTNLSLGTAAVAAATAFDAAGAASSAQSAAIAVSAQRSNNLNDLANVSTARTNLGLGTAAMANTTAFDAAGAASSAQSAAIAASAQRSNNLNDLASASSARTNLGLGSSAVLPVSAANGVAGLDGNTKVAAAQLTNRPAIAPSTTAGGTAAVTVFPAGTYASIVLSSTTQMSASGTSTAPSIGDANTVVAGQQLFWPSQPGGSMPTQPIQVVCSASCTITATAF